MDVALLFLPLIGGFIFSQTWFGTRYACAREEGHRLYFRAGFVAVFLFAIAALLRFLLNEIPCYGGVENWLARMVKDTAKQTDFGSLFALTMVCVYAMLIAWPLAIVLNKIGNWTRSLEKALEHSPIERLLRASILREKPVAITLENRKVYIGYVVASPDPAQDIKAIQILPLASGYRDKDNLELAITTDYAAIFKSESERLVTKDFVIVLPITRVMNLSIFDMTAFAKFQNANSRPHQPDNSQSDSPPDSG